MNYHEVYAKLIAKAKARKLDVNTYRERHHIVPKCLGGQDDVENIVELTSREHYIAHLLLCKMHPNNNKLMFAFKAMCVYPNNGKREVKKSRVYEQLRLKGRLKHSSESKQKMRYAKLGKTYEEIHGAENAQLIKERKKLNVGNCNPNYRYLDARQIKQYIDDGKTLKEIRELLDTTFQTISNRFKEYYNSTISEYTNSKGLTKNGSRINTAVDASQIMQLIQQGKTINEIQLIVNASPATIRKRFREAYNKNLSDFVDLRGKIKNRHKNETHHRN